MKRIKDFRLFEDTYYNSKGGRFWGNEGAGVLPICRVTGRILVAYRSEDVNEPHTYGIFGGKIDRADETPEEAARRELQEESGYKKHFEIIPAYVWESPDDTFKYSNFIGIVDAEFKAKLDWETENTLWLTLQELLDLEPKHFGLKALLKNSIELIKSYAR